MNSELTNYLASNDWLIERQKGGKLWAADGRLRVAINYDERTVKLYCFTNTSRYVLAWSVSFESAPSAVIIAAIKAAKP